MYIIFIQKKKKKKSTPRPQSINKYKKNKKFMNTPWRDHYAVTTIPAPNDQSFIMWALQPNLRQGN